MRVPVGQPVFPAGVAAEIPARVVQPHFFPRHHARPDGVHVYVAGVVEHVQREPARRADVHFQREEGAVLGAEELEVEEPLAHLEALDEPAPGLLDVGRDLPERIVVDVRIGQDRFHDALVVGVRGAEDYLAVAPGQPVEGDDVPGDELLGDEFPFRLFTEKRIHFRVVVQLIGERGAHPVVRLYDDGEVYFLREGLGLRRAADDGAPGVRYAGGGEHQLHAGFPADICYGVVLDAVYAELGAQGGFGLQPVFVQRIQPVDMAEFFGEEAAGLPQLFVIVHVAYFIVPGQRPRQLRVQVPEFRVADAEGVEAGGLEAAAEILVVRREMRRQEDEIHRLILA